MRGPEGEHEEGQTETKTEETQGETKTEESLVTSETKAEETKTEETKTEEAVVVEPIKLEDLSVPEGFELQPELANEFLEILNGEMEPKDRVNSLLALHAKTINAAQEADSSAWEDMQTKWKDEVKADPDIGGAKLQPTLTSIGKLLDEYGSKELREVFNFTGAGNHPEMIKFLNKISGVLTEGGYNPGATPSNAADSEQAKAERLFPSAAKSKG